MSGRYVSPVCRMAEERPDVVEHGLCHGNVAYVLRTEGCVTHRDRCDCRCHEGQPERPVVLGVM